MNIAVPSKPWEVLHMDFIVDLPESEGKTTILTVVDRFSKMAEFIGLAATDAVTVANAFFTRVVCMHGMPKCIISDRDSRFTGHFWRELMSLCSTSLAFSTAFHPQSDGMAEVTNRTIEALIRLHCSEDSTQWFNTLPYL